MFQEKVMPLLFICMRRPLNPCVSFAKGWGSRRRAALSAGCIQIPRQCEHVAIGNVEEDIGQLVPEKVPDLWCWIGTDVGSNVIDHDFDEENEGKGEPTVPGYTQSRKSNVGQ